LLFNQICDLLDFFLENSNLFMLNLHKLLIISTLISQLFSFIFSLSHLKIQLV
jgi:hypothetical protein